MGLDSCSPPCPTAAKPVSQMRMATPLLMRPLAMDNMLHGVRKVAGRKGTVSGVCRGQMLKGRGRRVTAVKETTS